MSKEYKLTTLQDILDKVPADRIEDCMKELATMFTDAKGLCEVTLKGQGKEYEAGDITLPEFITWIDDGKGDIQAIMEPEDGEGPSIRIISKAS